MIAFGSRASISSTGIECGTISEYTPASRTRRAISCAYCAPKSTTRTGWCAVWLMGDLRGDGGCGGCGRGSCLELGEFTQRAPGDEVLDDERQEWHDTAEGDRDEPGERPAHDAPQAEVAKQVHDVETTVSDQDAE